MIRHAVLIILLLCTLCVVSYANRPAEVGEPLDITAVKDKLKFLTDGKHHYILARPFDWKKSPFLYSSDGEAFYEQFTKGYGQTGDGTAADDSFDRDFWDPRAKTMPQASFGYRKGRYRVHCPGHETPLTLVGAAGTAKLLATAKFYKRRWTRQPYALARDNTGTYYYVDVAAKENSKDFRLYVGKKGSLTLQRMTNVVSDSQGDIFSTRSGSLRLILNKGESLWQVHDKIQKLRVVPLDEDDNRVLVYTDLGVYTGQRLGTPCDDL